MHFLQDEFDGRACILTSLDQKETPSGCKDIEENDRTRLKKTISEILRKQTLVKNLSLKNIFKNQRYKITDTYVCFQV